MDPFFDDYDDELAGVFREPVFYTDGRRAPPVYSPDPVSRFIYVAGPAWDVATTLEEAKAALVVASMAWNITRLPEPERRAALGVAIDHIVGRTGDASDFSEMVLRAMRWRDEQWAVVEAVFKELRPGEWHVALLTITPAQLKRRASSPAAKARGRHRG